MAYSSEKDGAIDQRAENVSAGSIRSEKLGKDEVSELSATEQLAATWVNGTPEEKALVRKLDWRILPCTWVLYLLGYLDRANIGYVFHHSVQLYLTD